MDRDPLRDRSRAAIRQAPIAPQPLTILHVAIAGLALGGAERIVLEWAQRLKPPWSAHLIVLRDHPHEWPVPATLSVTRLHGVDVLDHLAEIGWAVARAPVATCLCHLLTATERRALASSGAFVVPVVHNARPGWLEPAAALDGARHVVAVSEASADDIRRCSHAGAVSVIRHIPRARRFPQGTRERWRDAWRIPRDATVIGMIGAVKPQKDYPFAVRLLQKLRERRDAYLVIVGGPTGKHGRAAWEATLGEIGRCGVRARVAMPGFVPDAAACLPACDLLLNTSTYEGLSIATLDARVNGVPVVASRVGGQGELGDNGLTLVEKEAPADRWIDAIVRALGSAPSAPHWAGFPAHRLWTLAHLARPYRPAARVLIATANLNAGGAQRSLINLATALERSSTAFAVEVVVAGESTADYFLEILQAACVPVHRTAAGRDPFDHAEALVGRISAIGPGVVCFWNLDAKVKLLVTKALAFTDAAIVDVSPGPARLKR